MKKFISAVIALLMLASSALAQHHRRQQPGPRLLAVLFCSGLEKGAPWKSQEVYKREKACPANFATFRQFLFLPDQKKNEKKIEKRYFFILSSS
jgi:hypothetical protein